jgi:hypothetical protein
MILAIDPGVHESACAWFDGGYLSAVAFEVAPSFLGVATVVVEKPQFDSRTLRVDPRDVINLAFAAGVAAGAAAANGAELIAVTPTQWKGSEPKPMQHMRLWESLTPAEQALLGGAATGKIILLAVDKGALRRWKISGAECYPRSFKTHNLLDAVALGCTHLGRLDKR